MSRETRRARWERICPSKDMFAVGLVMTLAFLLNPSTMLRLPQVCLFWGYAWLSGRKLRPLLTVTVMLGIIVFNLLSPYGRVLAEFGPFTITQGSLAAGLHKALTLEGLLMLSSAVIRRDLRLPGSLGALTGESFRLFYQLPRLKGLITRQDPIGGIDRLLLALSAEQEAAGPESAGSDEPPVKRGRQGLLILAALTLPVIGLTIAGIWREGRIPRLR
jgi:heptaprenyl diphosphate synthase